VTKASTLKYLLPHLRQSKIDNFISFTVGEWNRDFKSILSKIQKNKLGNTLIIRSSAVLEDNATDTHAGIYKSILNISSNNVKLITSAVNKVIDSFYQKKDFNLSNEIIVQRQLLNPLISGVIFTRDPKTDAPYYIIEYDNKSGQTNLVTGAGKRKLIRIARFASSKVMFPWSCILSAVQEIEMFFPEKILDIEFAIDRRKIVHIFQVRLLLSNRVCRKNDKVIKSTLNKLSLSVSTCNPIIYSDMADWNPIEMLGTRPNKLAISLYRFLITKDTWYKARTSLGYTDLETQELMITFAGKPYIDINASLFSLTPSSLPAKIRNRLVRYQINKLREKPYLHDKIEFTVAYSCSDVVISKRTRLLFRHGFSKQEIIQIEDSLNTLTQTLLNNVPNLIKESKILLSTLASDRKKYIKQPNLSSLRYLNELLLSIEKLLTNCKDKGSYVFARLARVAFIGHALLRQLLYRKAITPEQYEKFFSSIETQVSFVRKDLFCVHKNIMPKKDFLEKYGHLRPGTYDITAPRYDQIPDLIFGKSNELSPCCLKLFQPDSEMLSKIEKIFREINLKINGEFFLEMVKEAIEWREKAKFEFTHTLSDVIELVAKVGSILGFTRAQCAYLDIEKILSSNNLDANISRISKTWQINIEKNKQIKEINDYILLPSLIRSKDDFLFAKTHESRPNFVTYKKIEAFIITLDRVFYQNIENLKGRIAFIEAADPGYDWIFAQGIVGLVTKYGGIASHMAIRCLELEIPAAIGCGEIIYEHLKEAKIICINAEEEKLSIIN